MTHGIDTLSVAIGGSPALWLGLWLLLLGGLVLLDVTGSAAGDANWLEHPEDRSSF